jgi:hypothetical protein
MTDLQQRHIMLQVKRSECSPELAHRVAKRYELIRVASFVSSAPTGLNRILAIPVVVFLVEFLDAAGLRRQNPLRAVPNGFRQIAVIVPVDNESIGVIPTLLDINTQIRSEDRLVVIADNCTDDTAVAAAAAGAEVIGRPDSTRRGRGYVQDCGPRHISKDQPDIVIDADCRPPNVQSSGWHWTAPRNVRLLRRSM